MAIEIGVLFAVATMLSWGAADYFAKKAIDKVGSVVALLLNQAIAIGPIVAFALLTAPMPALSVNLVLLVLITGVLSLLGYFYLYKGLSKGNLSVVSPISASWFVITALLAAILFTEILTPLHTAGILVVFAGVFLASTNLSEFRRSVGLGRSNGVLEALISMVTWGFAFALVKPIVDAAGPVMALLMTRIVAGGSLLLWTKAAKTQLSLPAKSVLMFLVAAGLLDAFGFAAYNIGVATQYVSVVSPIAAAYPAVSILLARFLLKEHLATTQKIGVVAILTGLALVALI
jgi:drug/metabolite transporter (DMT)-like permease